MECPEIKELLSEYVDGVLDSEKSARVARHLESCADCRDELDALGRVIRSLGSMGVMKAPDGFMEEVHQRIERRSRLSRISRSLFVPFRVKIPIQVASLATACILVLLIFHNMRTSEEVTNLMQEPGREVAAEKAMEAAPEPAKLGKGSKRRPTLLKAENIQKKKAEKPIELALRVSKGSEYAFSRQEKPAPAAEKRLARSNGKRKQRYPDETSGAKAPEEALSQKSSSREADLAEKPASMPAADAEKQTADRAGLAIPGDYSKLSAEMKRWTLEAGGRILNTGYEEVTGRPASFYVEIPAGQLAAFLEKLSGIGSLETGVPASPRRTGEMVRLDIRLTYDR